MRKKLRQQIAEKLREHNYGPLYKGNKKKFWRSVPTWELRHMLWQLSLKPGDLVNDCDGWNHRIVGFKYPPYRYTHRLDYQGIQLSQFEFEDGTLSCGCPSGPDEPLTVEQITSCFQKYIENADETWLYVKKNAPDFKEAGIENPKEEVWYYTAIKRGLPICDEFGIKKNPFED